MSDSVLSLDEIGIRFGTDKSSIHHNYLRFYERYFNRYRDKSIKILEVGVFNGASIKTWHEYFPNAIIIGVDINWEALRFEGGRVRIEIADQSNLDDLVRLGTKHGPFDIIIEDGSHMWEHQITTLKTLYPFLAADGIYIVEDLQTNYGEACSGYRGVASISCIDYLKKAIDLRVADDMIDISKEEDAFLRTFARCSDFTFYGRACLIEKHYRPISRINHDKELITGTIAAPPGSVGVVLLAHLGYVGNVMSNQGSIKPRLPAANIQGFRIYVNESIQEALVYRARRKDGSWTEWVKNDVFVGTRGAGEDLTGFSVRLEGDVARQYRGSLIGIFNADEQVVKADLGEDCTLGSKLVPLHGMHIMLWRSDDL